jgi:hypothetical protein
MSPGCPAKASGSVSMTDATSLVKILEEIATVTVRNTASSAVVCPTCGSPEADSAGPSLESQKEVGRAVPPKKSHHTGWCATCQESYETQLSVSTHTVV